MRRSPHCFFCKRSDGLPGAERTISSSAGGRHVADTMDSQIADAPARQQGEASTLFYLVTYTVSRAGAFGALILCGRRGAEAVSYEDLSGVGRLHPLELHRHLRPGPQYPL